MREETRRLAVLDRERSLLTHIGALLGWDQETYLPSGGVEERAEQLALIEGLAHDKAVVPEIGYLLSSLEAASDLEERERAYLKVARREYDRETKLPASLVTEKAKRTSLSQAAWVEARRNDDFRSFAPHLRKMIDLNLEMADVLDPEVPPYDVLLDLYELGSDEASIAAVFGRMKTDLIAILDKILGRPQVDDSFLQRRVPAEAQALMSEDIMDILGFDRTRGRLDTTVHPFTTTLGARDVRITTRYIEDCFPSSVFSTIHETGHALYEMGIELEPEFAGTRLAEPASMAVHESQSRFWENIVGRSLPFWKKNYKRLTALSRGALDGVGVEAFVKAVNKVQPSLIRTEADEVTYGLHIIARFELESDLVSGRLQVADLPEAWKAKMKALLGVDVPDDARGCLQDIHWSMGSIGYFPSYALGNLYAAQFWVTMKDEIPGLEAGIEAGDLVTILSWLRKKIHSRGAALTPAEIILEATGFSLNPGHYTNYLEEKYSAIYGF
ncbi:MAG: carboxypeptidase M32 [Spirochaetes bacterium]|nr:carboxypeptidase M32 [Spirochaetota bacterium]